MSNSEEPQLESLPDELILSCLARVSRSDYGALSLVSKRYHSLVVSRELYKARFLLGYEEETSTSLPSLPYQLALTCMARVSISDYVNLSLASKKLYSLIVSLDIYKRRSLLGYTEECLYVCFGNNLESTSRWFVLRQGKTNITWIPRFFSKPPEGSSVVALDWGVYVIGGLIKEKPTSDVLLLDFRTNTWRKLPSMRVARSFSAAGVIDGKIYVFGGCEDMSSSNWGEVFDVKTQSWDTLVPKPDQNIRMELISASLVIEGKIYAVSQSRSLYYSPSEGKWGVKNIDSKPYLGSYNCCVMMREKLLCSMDESGKLFWCEKEDFKWKEVKGLDKSEFFRFRPPLEVKLSNFGENILVFFRMDEPYSATRSNIWCGEISLERRKEGDEVWGNVQWLTALRNHSDSHRGRVLHSASVNL